MILGVSFGYHDASAALVHENKVIAFSAEERFTKERHDANFPMHAIRFCLAEAGISADELDQVVFHEDPHKKFTRVLSSTMAPYPHSRVEFVNAVKSWFGQKLWTINSISKRLDVDPEKVFFLNHHFSHAVQGFMGSGFESAGILVVDAVGEWSSSSLFRAEWKDGKPVVKRILDVNFPHSLGLTYSAVTAYLGFRPNDGECSTMALAGFGKPRYADNFRQIIRKSEDSTYEIDQAYFNFERFYENAFTPAFQDKFGASRNPKNKLPLSCLSGSGASGDGEGARFADIACSVQTVFEERVQGLAEVLRKEFPSDNLCIAGGAALNCVNNSKLLSRSGFKNVFIPPDPGDGGTALGASLYASALRGRFSAADFRISSPYLGPSFVSHAEADFMASVKPARLRKFHKTGIEWREPKEWTATRYDFSEISLLAARELFAGRIVGWFQGRAEMGPRALGNRSILIRPDDTALAARLSREVKDREGFRPYALSMTEAAALEILSADPATLRMNRWMQYAVPVRQEMLAKVRAGAHVDGSTRPQVCFEEDNPRFHRLLSDFGALSGTACLLNTSLNESGGPLCNAPVDALTIFCRTNMDILIVEDLVYRKIYEKAV